MYAPFSKTTITFFILFFYRNYRVFPVKVQYSEKMDPNALYYDLTGKGLAVIFNHSHFYANRYPERPGSDNDAERLEYSLLNLNFSCKIYDNSTIYDIETIMETSK